MFKLVKNKNIYLFEFISVYFGIFADSYDFYKFLNKYYLNLGYSSAQIDEIFEDFCNNLNKRINIKIFKAKNIYIYSFILNGVRYYEFRSNKLYKFKNNQIMLVNIKFIDFLRFYYNDVENLIDANHLKKLLKEDGFNLDEINFILNSLNKEVEIRVKDIGNCYENLIIVGNFYIYFDSIDEFKG